MKTKFTLGWFLKLFLFFQLISTQSLFAQFCDTGLYGNPCSVGNMNYISNVKIVGTSLSNSTACSGNVNTAVNYYPAADSTTASIQQGNTYTLSVTTSDSSVISVWFDFNHNNVFDVSEWNLVTLGSSANVPSSYNFTVPYTTVGLTAMRIRIRNAGITVTGSDACATNWLSGELEQYMITILPAPLCTSMPAAGNAISSVDTVCSSTSFTLSMQGAAIAQGLTQQWESSNDGITWIPISGATGTTLTTTQYAATYYHCLVTCGGSTTISTSKFVTMLPTEYYDFNSGTIYTEHFDYWMDGCDVHDIPSINWLNYPITGNESWRKQNEGNLANWTAPSPLNIVVPFLGAGAARFHSFSGNMNPGALDLHLNCTNFSSINLDFWYLKKQVLLNVSKFEVSVSTNGGLSFGPPIAVYTTANQMWLNKVISNVLVWNSPTCIIRFQDFGDYQGTFDTALDELRIDGILGTSDVDNDFSSIQISPNPSKGLVEIRSSHKQFAKCNFELLDLTGRLILNEKFDNNSVVWNREINLSNQAKGIYFVKLISDAKVFTQKIILE